MLQGQREEEELKEQVKHDFLPRVPVGEWSVSLVQIECPLNLLHVPNMENTITPCSVILISSEPSFQLTFITRKKLILEELPNSSEIEDMRKIWQIFNDFSVKQLERFQYSYWIVQ